MQLIPADKRGTLEFWVARFQRLGILWIIWTLLVPERVKARIRIYISLGLGQLTIIKRIFTFLNYIIGGKSRKPALPSPAATVKSAPTLSPSIIRLGTHVHSNAVATATNLLHTLYKTPIGPDRLVVMEKDGVTITSHPSRLTTFRGDGSINGWTCQEVLSVIRCREARRVWDARFDGSDVLQVLSATDVLVHSRQKGSFGIVSGRDFVLVSSLQACDDQDMQHLGLSEAKDGWMFLSTSVEDSKGPKVGSNLLVRAHLHVAGWVLVPKKNDGVTVSYIVKVDVGGSIPQAVLKSVQSQSPLCISHIRSYLSSRNFIPFVIKGGSVHGDGHYSATNPPKSLNSGNFWVTSEDAAEKENAILFRVETTSAREDFNISFALPKGAYDEGVDIEIEGIPLEELSMERVLNVTSLKFGKHAILDGIVSDHCAQVLVVQISRQKVQDHPGPNGAILFHLRQGSEGEIKINGKRVENGGISPSCHAAPERPIVKLVRRLSTALSDSLSLFTSTSPKSDSSQLCSSSQPLTTQEFKTKLEQASFIPTQLATKLSSNISATASQLNQSWDHAMDKAAQTLNQAKSRLPENVNLMDLIDRSWDRAVDSAAQTVMSTLTRFPPMMRILPSRSDSGEMTLLNGNSSSANPMPVKGTGPSVNRDTRN